MSFDLTAARARVRAGFPLVNDHPDVAGVLRDPALLALLGPALAAPFHHAAITAVCAPEARGPILGALVAVQLRAGLVLVRKDDRNHPGADRRVESSPTWRGASEVFQTRSWDLSSADRVLVVDDWITTGSSLAAMKALVEQSGASYCGASILVDKASASTRERYGVHSLVRFDELVAPAEAPPVVD
jgi:adenine phosphoribosyltransferase